MENGLTLTFGGANEGRMTIRIDGDAAWIENEKGEQAKFADAKELDKEVYLAIENLFKSMRG